MKYEGILILAFILKLVTSSNNVIELTDENFISEIGFHDKMVVLFHSKSFNNSKLFLPKFEEFANKVIDHVSSDVKFGSVEIVTNEKTTMQYEIIRVPVIKYIHHNKRVLSYDIDRERNLENLVLWYRRVTENVINVTETIDIDKLTKEEIISVVLFGSEQSHPEIYKILKKISNYYEFHYFFSCDNPTCSNHLNGTSGQIVLFKNFDEKRNEIRYNVSADNQTTFSDLLVNIDSYSKRISPEYNDKYYEYVYINKNPAVFLYNLQNHSNFEGIEKIFNESAKENREKIQYIRVNNMEKNPLHINMAEFNGFEKSDFPVIMIHDMVKGYDFKFTSNFTLEELNKFIFTWFRGPIKPFFKSENFNNTDSSLMIKLTRNNFEEVVFNVEKDNDVIVNFYADWNANSRNFSKIYEEFFEKTKNRTNFKVAKIDISKNYMNDFIDLESIPTIMLFPRENKTNPFEFDDERTVENLISFVNQNLNTTNTTNTTVKTDL